MGKKKSTVLMVLLTIVIVVLCAITAFPAMPVLGTVYNWKPAVMQYDLGADLGGGYYTYYYPNGVITATEYNERKAELSGDELAEFVASYEEHGSLYLDKDSDIFSENEISEDFKNEFEELTNVIAARYAAKGYSDYCVSVVDDYSLRVAVPTSEDTKEREAYENAVSTFGLFLNTGAVDVLRGGTSVVDEEEGVQALIEGVSTYSQYGTVYLSVKFTDAGVDVMDDFLLEMESVSAESSSTEKKNLQINVGETAFIELNENNYDPTSNSAVQYKENELRYAIANEAEKGYVETIVILLNSALENGGFDIEFQALPESEVRTHGSIYGEFTLILLYVAVAVALLASIVYSIVKMGGFGVASAYSTVSYLIVAGLCFAFITGGVYEVTYGTALVFLLGLALMNAINVYVYNAIKTEFGQGKTVESSIKNGYKKTIWNVVDIYAVLLVGALALLIGAAGLSTLATQAIVCIVTGAFCNLLWTRVINYMTLSMSKNKYKYFRFVREEEEDDE